MASLAWKHAAVATTSSENRQVKGFKRFNVKVGEYTVSASAEELAKLAKLGGRVARMEVKIDRETTKVARLRMHYTRNEPVARKERDTHFDRKIWGFLLWGTGLIELAAGIGTIIRGQAGSVAGLCWTCGVSAMAFIGSLVFEMHVRSHERMLGKNLEIYGDKLLDAKVEEAGLCQELLRRARQS